MEEIKKTEPPVTVYADLESSVETAFKIAERRYGDLFNGAPVSAFHQRNAKDALLVRALAAHGDTEEEIATALGYETRVVSKWYKKEFDEGQNIAKAKVKKMIFDLCMEGDKEMLKLYAKTQLGWSETKKVQQEVSINVLTKEQRDAMVKASEGMVIDA